MVGLTSAGDHYDRLQSEVHELKNEVTKVATILGRIDPMLESVGKVTHDMSNLIAVHEMKLGQTAQSNKNLEQIIELRRVEAETKNQELHRRISSGERAMAKRADDLSEELVDLIKELKKHSEDQYEAINKRLRTLEKVMYLLAGAISAYHLFFDKSLPITSLIS